MTRNLSISLAKLDSTRAAMHTDPSSPTSAAVRGFEENVGEENKNIKVTGILEQAQQDEADAAYARFAGSQALLAGDISMGGDVLSGLSGAVRGLPGGSLGNSSIGNPTQIGALYLSATVHVT